MAIPPPAAAGPFEDLAAKKKELTHLKDLMDQAHKDVQAKQTEVQSLETFLGDTDKIVQAYAAALPKLSAELQALKDLTAAHRKEVDAVLGAVKVKSIADVITAVDADLAKLQKAADDSAGDAADKQKAADVAAAAAKQADATLAALKKSQAAADDALKPLRSLRDQEAKADAMETPGSNENKAVFVLELESTLAPIALSSADELRTNLLAALAALDASKKKVDTATADAATAKKAAGDAAKAYAAAAVARLDTILAGVSKL